MPSEPDITLAVVSLNSENCHPESIIVRSPNWVPIPKSPKIKIQIEEARILLTCILKLKVRDTFLYLFKNIVFHHVFTTTLKTKLLLGQKASALSMLWRRVRLSNLKILSPISHRHPAATLLTFILFLWPCQWVEHGEQCQYLTWSGLQNTPEMSVACGVWSAWRNEPKLTCRIS